MTLPAGYWAGPLAPDTCYGSLAIAGVSMFTTAWCVTSLASLYDDPSLRGADRILPGVLGVRKYRRRATATLHSLPFLVTGVVTTAGLETTVSPYAQLTANLRYLKANVTLPTNTGDGTRPAVLTLPDGTTVTKDVHVLGLHGDLHPGALWSGTLDISDPTGTFHAGGT